MALSKPQKIDDIRVFALRPDAKMKKPHRLVVDIPVIGAKQTYTKKASSAASSSPASSYKKQSYNVSSDAKSVLKGKIICIDPGHGGTDVGAIGHIGGKDVYEKNITLSIALPLRDMLTSAGAKVVMTRDTDKDVYGPGPMRIRSCRPAATLPMKPMQTPSFPSISIPSPTLPLTAPQPTTTLKVPKTCCLPR